MLSLLALLLSKVVLSLEKRLLQVLIDAYFTLSFVVLVSMKILEAPFLSNS